MNHNDARPRKTFKDGDNERQGKKETQDFMSHTAKQLNFKIKLQHSPLTSIKIKKIVCK